MLSSSGAGGLEIVQNVHRGMLERDAHRPPKGGIRKGGSGERNHFWVTQKWLTSGWQATVKWWFGRIPLFGSPFGGPWDWRILSHPGVLLTCTHVPIKRRHILALGLERIWYSNRCRHVLCPSERTPRQGSPEEGESSGKSVLIG